MTLAVFLALCAAVVVGALAIAHTEQPEPWLTWESHHFRSLRRWQWCAIAVEMVQ